MNDCAFYYSLHELFPQIYIYENITLLEKIIFITVLNFSKKRSLFDNVLSLGYRGWVSVVERSFVPVLSVAMARAVPRREP